MPKLVFVVAAARNGAIGKAGALPWRLPSDLKRFRETTWGRPMVMGRKTYRSIGKPLPGRETIVVTRDPSFAAEGVHVAATIEAALEIGAARAKAMGVDEIMVVGGAEIYAALLPQANRVVLTEVDMAPDADAFMPPFDPGRWTEVSREAPARGPKDEAEFVIRVLERS
jgi:dihydrofolate reductase